VTSDSIYNYQKLGGGTKVGGGKIVLGRQKEEDSWKRKVLSIAKKYFERC